MARRNLSGLNRRIPNCSMTLRDALLGYFAAGGTEAEIASSWERYFKNNPQVKEPFMRTFREMMADESYSFNDKIAYFLDRLRRTEAEAHKILEDAWRLATGTEWSE